MILTPIDYVLRRDRYRHDALQDWRFVAGTNDVNEGPPN